MATFSSSSSFLIPRNFLQNPAKPFKNPPLETQFPAPQTTISPSKIYPQKTKCRCRGHVSSHGGPVVSGRRRLYIGNIPRTVTNDDLQKIVEEHGAVEKAEVMYDKYSGRSRRFAFEVGGREIKVNITEKPLTPLEMSLLQAEESQFVDSPYKVYVGNLAKTVTMDTLKDFFAAKGKVVSAKISRVPGTSKSSGYGFVSFGSEEDVEAAISSLNNAVLEGQKIRVNKA
ncbi:30S ribosomal protein 2 chloroplastic [Phtheirospermum japonicum]|uniref:Small ribosomal subunit protein cS22 n=1 Tax=Phtheirospermum japonicum TaxID=374723 RepID=A0A830C7X5_9LAMI|nr:30S ribosomal protein 2 chloroplastic [Phtheirospermum japonicum]